VHLNTFDIRTGTWLRFVDAGMPIADDGSSGIVDSAPVIPPRFSHLARRSTARISRREHGARLSHQPCGDSPGRKSARCVSPPPLETNEPGRTAAVRAARRMSTASDIAAAEPSCRTSGSMRLSPSQPKRATFPRGRSPRQPSRPHQAPPPFEAGLFLPPLSLPGRSGNHSGRTQSPFGTRMVFSSRRERTERDGWTRCRRGSQSAGLNIQWELAL